MYLQTHIAATFLGIILLMDFVESKMVFVIVALVATFIPDIDNKSSKLGRKRIFRPLQVFLKHRGILHSFTFLGIVCILLYFWTPVVSYGFALGYGLHLILDAFTVWGIRPFWPFKWKIKGKMKTGKGFEIFIFVSLLIIDLVLIFNSILGVF